MIAGSERRPVPAGRGRERRDTRVPTSGTGWAEDTEAVRRRYRHLAEIYRAFEPILWLPRGIRQMAVDRLGLVPGGRVLEVGCGTGRNLPFLVRAVGPSGRVYGVDVTAEMLAVARRSVAEHRWQNVVLIEGDAERAELPEPVDAALFSLSYGVIPRHREVLETVWGRTRPGGRIVVLDARIPEGGFGEVLRPVATALSRRTVLGDPDKRPWEDLGRLAPVVHTERVWPGIYYLCWADRSDGTVGNPPAPSAGGSWPAPHPG